MYFLGILFDMVFGIIHLLLGSIFLSVSIFWKSTSVTVRGITALLSIILIFSGKKLVTLDFPLASSLIRIDFSGIFLGILVWLIATLSLWYSMWIVEKKTPQRLLGYGLSAIFAVSAIMLMARGYIESFCFTAIVVESLALFVSGLALTYVKPLNKRWAVLLNYWEDIKWISK